MNVTNEKIIDIISMNEFNEIIKTSTKPVLVDFWATWCMPCKMQAPILHDFADSLEGKITVLKVDVDKNEELSASLNIMSIPTIVLYVGGVIKEKKVGLSTKAALSEMVIKYL